MKSQKINFIPGFTEKPSNYKMLSRYFNILNINWNNPRLNLKNRNVLVAFSFGGVLVLEYALKNKVGTLILCSLTPLVETLEKVKTDQVIFLVGEKEKFLLKNVRRVAKTLPKNTKRKIVVIPGADHEIKGNYQKKLLEIANTLKS